MKLEKNRLLGRLLKEIGLLPLCFGQRANRKERTVFNEHGTRFTTVPKKMYKAFDISTKNLIYVSKTANWVSFDESSCK